MTKLISERHSISKTSRDQDFDEIEEAQRTTSSLPSYLQHTFSTSPGLWLVSHHFALAIQMHIVSNYYAGNPVPL